MTFAQSLITSFLQPLLSFILLIFFAYVIMSWLFMFRIISPSSPMAMNIFRLLSSVVEPIVAPFRKIIPPLGNFDMGFFFAAMLLYWINSWLLPSFVLPALG